MTAGTVGDPGPGIDTGGPGPGTGIGGPEAETDTGGPDPETGEVGDGAEAGTEATEVVRVETETAETGEALLVLSGAAPTASFTSAMSAATRLTYLLLLRKETRGTMKRKLTLLQT